MRVLNGGGLDNRPLEDSQGPRKRSVKHHRDDQKRAHQRWEATARPQPAGSPWSEELQGHRGLAYRGPSAAR